MKTIALLIRSNLLSRPTRTLLTTMATAASVCLLIWIVSVYLSAIRSFDLYASRALGRYQLIVDPVSRKVNREVDPQAIEILRARDEVATIDPMWARLLTVRAEPGGASIHPVPQNSNGYAAEEVLIGTDAAEPPFDLINGRWVDGDQTESLEVVISKALSELLGVGVDDGLVIPGPTNERPRLEIIGVIEPPPPTVTGAMVGSRMLPSPSVGGLFCSMRDASWIHRTKPIITFAGVVLTNQADVHAFRYELMPELYKLDNPAQFMTDLDMEEEMSEAAKAGSLSVQAYVVGALATLMSFLAIYSTLSMGVNERTRHLALLRAVALTKQQLAILIAGEGLILVGLGLAVGVPAGWILIRIVDSATKGLIRHGMDVFPVGILISIGISGVAALLAAMLPAWRATRVRPLDAIAPKNQALSGRHNRTNGWLVAIAIPLLAVLPWISFIDAPGPADPVLGRLVFGSVALVIGLLLLTPVLIGIVERSMTTPLARCLRLPPKLLAKQLASQLRRTTACAMTLSVGVGMFAGIHVWGQSMVQAFIPTAWAPDTTIVFEQPLSDLALRQVTSRRDEYRVEPLIVEQPRLRDDVLNSAEFPSVTRQMVVVLAGIDPENAFAGPDPFIETDWIAGTPTDAAIRMKKERGCVVPDHFLMQSGLSVGDELVFVPPESPQQTRRYTIAGAVRLRGGQWMTKTTDMRQRTHRSAGLIFADYQHVAEDFLLSGPRHLWVRSGGRRLDRSRLTEDAKSLDGQDVARSAGRQLDTIRIIPTTDIGNQIRRSAQFWLWFMSIVPLIAMAISSLTMVNMFLASVQARQWDFGILRSIGFSRSVLVRIVIAEGVLVGVIACAVGTLFGIIAGWSGTALTQATSWFGGMRIDVAMPLTSLAIGNGVMLCFAAFAAVWPALRIGLTSPLTLLSQGRDPTH
ncbi:MAG: ABC transporter permease [Planctomycetota bacterium]